MANFGEAAHTTELCNLMLLATPKPTERKVLKRPGAAPPEAEAPMDAPPVAAADVAPAKDDYGIMYYGKASAIGIRAKFGAKNQILEFGSTRCTKTEEEMREIAKVIVADLHAGMSPAKAKKKGQRLAGL